jgi:hypothetical protein
VIPHLSFGYEPRPYVVLLWILFVLFVGRVVGQILVAIAGPRWLPPMERWYSGVMPYRYLLPSQVVIIALMIAMIVAVTNQTGPLGGTSAAIGVTTVVASCTYAAGMVWRAVRRAMQPPERRGVVIPIVFHFVLAAFLFVYGSWHVEAAGAEREGTLMRTYSPERE